MAHLVKICKTFDHLKNISVHNENIRNVQKPMIPPLIKPFQKFGTKEMYQILIENNTKPACERSWSKALEINIPNKIWQEIYKLPFLIENTTLQWFQFRINNKILGTNLFLHKTGYKISLLCNF